MTAQSPEYGMPPPPISITPDGKFIFPPGNSYSEAQSGDLFRVANLPETLLKRMFNSDQYSHPCLFLTSDTLKTLANAGLLTSIVYEEYDDTGKTVEVSYLGQAYAAKRGYNTAQTQLFNRITGAQLEPRQPFMMATKGVSTLLDIVHEETHLTQLGNMTTPSTKGEDYVKDIEEQRCRFNEIITYRYMNKDASFYDYLRFVYNDNSSSDHSLALYLRESGSGRSTLNRRNIWRAVDIMAGYRNTLVSLSELCTFFDPKLVKSLSYVIDSQERQFKNWMTELEYKQISPEVAHRKGLEHMKILYELHRDIPNYSYADLKMGSYYEQLGEPDTAIEFYRKANEKSEGFDPIYAREARERLRELGVA